MCGASLSRNQQHKHKGSFISFSAFIEMYSLHFQTTYIKYVTRYRNKYGRK